MLDNDEREGADILALEYAMQEVKEGKWELALEIVGRNGRKVPDSEKGAEKRPAVEPENIPAEPEARQDPGKNETQREEQTAPSLPIRTSERKSWADMEDEGLDDTLPLPPLPPPSQATAVQAPRVTQVPRMGGTAETAPVAPLRSRFGPWQDSYGKNLPCYPGVGAGEVILPPNMDVFSHIRPARKEVQSTLKVRTWFQDKDSNHECPSVTRPSKR